MNYANSVKEVFHGLPVEHCPMCGELISIEKSEIIQSSEINCKHCMSSILAYLPKQEGQLFFTKECNNCRKMNNTRTQYCIYCGYNFYAKRKRFQFTAPKFIAYISLVFSLSGIILIIISFTGIQIIIFYVGAATTLIGFLFGLISRTNPKTKVITIISLIVSGSVIVIALSIFYLFFYILF